VENRRKKKIVSLEKDDGSQLLLTEEQWKAKYMVSSREKSGGRDNSGRGGRGRGHGSGHGDGGSNSNERRDDSVGLMGLLRSDVSAAASQAILPVTAGPRPCKLGPRGGVGLATRGAGGGML
jgi:hypothetical protein